MEHKRRNFFDVKVVFAFFIIAAGILMMLDNFGYYVNFSIWDWWPLILIVIGVGQFMQPKELRQTLTGSLLIILGGLFLCRNLDFCPFRFWEIWPVVLIFVGIMILRNHVWKKELLHGEESFINLFFFLGGGDYSYPSHRLEGGSLNAVMGGGKIDLRESSIVGDTLILDVFIMWGGIEVIIPKNWKVNVQGLPIMAGIENKTSISVVKENGTVPGKAEKQVIIKGLVLMGGLEIKN